MHHWLYDPPIVMQFKGHHYISRNHIRFNHTSTASGFNSNGFIQNSSSTNNHIYPGAQLQPMGGEVPLYRSQGHGQNTRGGIRGGSGGRGWRTERSYLHESQSDISNIPLNCYNQVPNLTTKKNVWNNKTQKSNTARRERGIPIQGHMNSAGDTLYPPDSLMNDLQGIPVLMHDSSKFYMKEPLQLVNVQQCLESAQGNVSNDSELRHHHRGYRRRSNIGRQSSAPTCMQRAIRGRYPLGSEALCIDFQFHEYFDYPGHLQPGNTVLDMWTKLSEEIWKKFVANQQTDLMFQNKWNLYAHIHSLITTKFPQYGLFLVGSTMSGFGCDVSDIDLCLLVRQSYMDQRSEAVVHLEQMLEILRGCVEFIEEPIVIQAKVPILKFRENRLGVEVDLNCNNAVGIRNTHLLYCYSQMDWRVQPLVLVVKLWAQRHNINAAKNMTISSYSLVLMVIHFLQCGTTPPVLPCLHSLYEGKFTPDSDINTIEVHEDLQSDYKSPNEQSLGQLLHDFLEYYVNFE